MTSGWKGTCSCVPSGKTYQIVSYSEGTCKEACVVNGKTVTTVCTKIGNQDDLSMSQVKNENGIIASRKKMTCGVLFLSKTNQTRCMACVWNLPRNQVKITFTVKIKYTQDTAFILTG